MLFVALGSSFIIAGSLLNLYKYRKEKEEVGMYKSTLLLGIVLYLFLFIE